MIYDAAISYAKEEAGRLREAEEALLREGFAVWTDRGLLPLGAEAEAERLVPAGVEHWEAIRDGIRRSATFVYLDSPAWRASAYCRKEHAFAQEQGIRMVAAAEPESLPAAVEKGLEVSRAHARIRAAGERGDGPSRWSGATGPSACRPANVGGEKERPGAGARRESGPSLGL